jgi:hypothetical protein
MFSFLPARRGTGAVDLADLRQKSAAGNKSAEMTLALLEDLERLPFFGSLGDLIQTRLGVTAAEIRQSDPGLLLELMVDPAGLGLLSRAKGLLPFHGYADGSRTAFEEHLHAGTGYLTDGSNPVRFHFTVAAEHQRAFREVSAKTTPGLAREFGTEVRVDFSLQDPATDTIAVEAEGKATGEPVRDGDGRLLFRPGGHGSLLTNLGRLARAGSGLVILKNIDNIAPETRHRELAHWKRLLIGHLVELRSRSFDLLDRLESAPSDPALLSEILDFLGHEFALDRTSLGGGAIGTDLARRLHQRLDRPLRVCGVVLNSGEPGGGPFWVKRQDGSIDGQIVEGSQIDHGSPEQLAIWSAASHFNPVDIACSLHDRTGKPYDLERYVDPSTYFVTSKEIGGRSINVLERPGLWNGSMADWNTAFVEVPERTFSPVKTLFDLLRPEHQG